MDTVDAWYAVLAPVKTAPDKIAQLHRDFSAVLTLPEVREQMEKQGLTIQISSPEQLGSLVQSDMARPFQPASASSMRPSTFFLNKPNG